MFQYVIAIHLIFNALQYYFILGNHHRIIIDVD